MNGDLILKTYTIIFHSIKEIVLDIGQQNVVFSQEE